jgi:hypothetical protein
LGFKRALYEVEFGFCCGEMSRVRSAEFGDIFGDTEPLGSGPKGWVIVSRRAARWWIYGAVEQFENPLVAEISRVPCPPVQAVDVVLQRGCGAARRGEREVAQQASRRRYPPADVNGHACRECVMPYTVDFDTVSTVGLESSPVAAGLAGLRAHEARYFKNKYDHVFTVEPASNAKTTIDWVHRILKEERDIVISSRPLEATAFQVENIRIAFLPLTRPRTGTPSRRAAPQRGRSASWR